jgi:hypothetical protein
MRSRAARFGATPADAICTRFFAAFQHADAGAFAIQVGSATRTGNGRYISPATSGSQQQE